MTKLIQFDFDNPNEREFKKLIDAFKRNGQELSEFFSNNRVVKLDRQRTKNVILYFVSGQSITLSINETGDLFKIKLNSSIIPVKERSSVAKLAKELANKIEANQKRFEASLARKAARAIKDTSTKRTVRKTTTQRMNEAKAAHAAATNSLNAMQTEFNEVTEKAARAENNVTKERNLINAAKAEKEQLLAQLDAMDE